MNPWKGLKGLPKQMWIVSFAVLINRMGTMVLPFLIIYLTARVGLQPGTAGFVFTFYGLGALCTAPFSGRLADKIGALLLMKISLFLSGIILLLYPFFKSYEAILFITFLWAVSGEAFRPASLSLIAFIVPVEKRKSAFALNRLMINLGMSIGPVAAGFLILYSFNIIFYVDALTSIIACGFLIFSKITVVEKHSDIVAPVVTAKISAFRDKRLVYFLLSLLPCLLVIFQFFGAMPVYFTHDLKFSTSMVGMLFAVNTILIIIVEVPLNGAIHAWPYKRSIALGALLTAVGFGSMAFARDIIPLVLAIVIWTFGEMMLSPSSSAYISEIAPREKQGEYMGFYQMVFSLALTFGPWLGTKFYASYGARLLWIGAFFFALISALLMLRIKNPLNTHQA
ncbi:MAG: MDR family MFS transporter [Methanococcaceae archaeon]